MRYVLDLVVVEKPQPDSRTYSSVPTVIELSWQGALVAGLYAGASGCPIQEYMPTEWKGSVAKPIAHSRLWKILEPDERVLLGGDATLAQIERAKDRGALARWAPGRTYYPETWLMHNILDAVALGCFHLGRIGR